MTAQQVRAVSAHAAAITYPSPPGATPSCPWGIHLKKKSGIGMHLSNYNLFSFLVPEGEALGNQTCSSHWNPASSLSLLFPLPLRRAVGMWQF